MDYIQKFKRGGCFNAKFNLYKTLIYFLRIKTIEAKIIVNIKLTVSKYKILFHDKVIL